MKNTERKISVDHCIEKNTKSPHIHLVSIYQLIVNTLRSTTKYLRAHKLFCPKNRSCCIWSLLCKPKISYFKNLSHKIIYLLLPLFFHENILRFDISMKISCFMKLFKSFDNLREVFSCFLYRKHSIFFRSLNIH